MKKSFFIILLLSLVISAFAETNVIYGEDNRVEVIESQNAMFVELASSTAAMIDKMKLRRDGDITKISGSRLGGDGICKSERFSEQMAAASCSGFLVAPNKLVTAGHCIKGESSCQNYKWVFDYKISHLGQSSVEVTSDKVYGCKRVINRELNSRNDDDWAIIELDREVTDRRILEVRRSGHVEVGEPLVVIGHPSGLPTKIADGANVRKLEDKFFVANLDTYGGNSGSAVFNANTGVVEGILVRGETDFRYDYSQRCRVSNVLADDAGRGEDVTYIQNVTDIE